MTAKCPPTEFSFLRTSANPDALFASELGAHPHWMQNEKAADRAGVDRNDRCVHCAKGMLPNTGWVVVVGRNGTTFLPLAEPLPRGAEIRRLGDACARRWFRYLSDADKARYFKR